MQPIACSSVTPRESETFYTRGRMRRSKIECGMNEDLSLREMKVSKTVKAFAPPRKKASVLAICLFVCLLVLAAKLT